MSTAIELKDLFKTFGSTIAVNHLTFSVEQGEVFGFLGPNGAGKTTTMRMLATLLKPDAGKARVLGHDVVREPGKVRRLIGYMPDITGTYRDMRVDEYLEFFAAAYDIPSDQRQRIVRDCLDLVGLSNRAATVIQGLSRGLSQRLGLARCLVNDPQVLILDEPASGLDPRARIEVQEIIRTLASMGKTILISSHILSELRNICSSIGILQNGRMLFEGSIDLATSLARTKRRLEIRLRERLDEAARVLEQHQQVSAVDCSAGRLFLEIANDVDDYSFVADALVTDGFKVLTIREEDIQLEDVFIHLTGGSNGGGGED